MTQKKPKRNTECHIFCYPSSPLFLQDKTDSLSQSVALKGTEISSRAGAEHDRTT